MVEREKGGIHGAGWVGGGVVRNAGRGERGRVMAIRVVAGGFNVASCLFAKFAPPSLLSSLALLAIRQTPH